MADLTTRPARSGSAASHGPTVPSSARPLTVSTLVVAVALVGAGLVVTAGLAVVGWLAAHDGSVEDAMRVGVTGWLAGHGAAPEIGGSAVRLVPLAFPGLVVLLSARGGRWAVATSGAARDRDAVLAALSGGLAYGVTVSGLAMTATAGDVVVDPVRAGLRAGLLVGAGLAVGLARDLGWRRRLDTLLPAPVGPALRGAAAGLLGVLAVATLVLLGALAVHAGDLVSLGGRLAPGPVGGVLLVLGCLLTLPNAVLWSAAYLLGPGFAVGVATSVSPSGVVLGPLPAFPLLAALPAPGDAPAWAPALLVLPVVAGALGGVLTARRLSAGPWWRTAVAGAAAGGLAGIVLALLLLVSGGAVGPGRMTITGPVPAAALVAIGSLTLGGLTGALGSRGFDQRAAVLDRLQQRLRRAR